MRNEHPITGRAYRLMAPYGRLPEGTLIVPTGRAEIDIMSGTLSALEADVIDSGERVTLYRNVDRPLIVELADG